MFEEIARGRSQGRFSFIPIIDCFWLNRPRHEAVMPLKTIGTIAIPKAAGSAFDHGAFDAKTRRVFIAHTARDCIEVIDHDAGRHIATLPGFPGAAVALLDAVTLETRTVFKTGVRPNGAVIVARSSLGIAACIGDDNEAPTLHLF